MKRDPQPADVQRVYSSTKHDQVRPPETAKKTGWAMRQELSRERLVRAAAMRKWDLCASPNRGIPLVAAHVLKIVVGFLEQRPAWVDRSS